MRELIEKYRLWHQDTPVKWKVAIIEKARSDGNMYFDANQDIDWLYDDCIDYLTDKTTRRITNLAKKMGYDEIPCLHCRNIIKYWNDDEYVKWSPDVAYLFEKC